MSRRETRSNFLARLKRTAKNLPPSFVLCCFKDMKVRCARLGAAEGGLFEEGAARPSFPHSSSVALPAPVPQREGYLFS